MTREEKQKAIDALKKSVPIMAVTQEEFADYIKTLNQIMDWLEQEPTRIQTKWIPNSDGNLPDKNGLYLVTYDYKPANQHEVIIARLHIPENEDDEFRWYDETDIEITLAVTAWMPLPEPYEPQESEDKE